MGKSEGDANLQRRDGLVRSSKWLPPSRIPSPDRRNPTHCTCTQAGLIQKQEEGGAKQECQETKLTYIGPILDRG